MSEIRESNNLGKKDLRQSELGKITENQELKASELETSEEITEELSDEDLNEPIDELVGQEVSSMDCRSECKYNTGSKSKYANYGFSD